MEDPLFWVFVLPGLLLGVYAQSRIKINLAKYTQVPTLNGITGAEVARKLLDAQGLKDVTVESTPGVLSDHYDPRTKTLRLSQQVYYAPNVAAAGIAAHETGHALQDAEDYFPMEARTYIVPVVQLAAQAAPWVFIAGHAAADAHARLGRNHPVRLVFPVRLAYVAGGVQCERQGERAFTATRHHPG